LTEAFTKQSLNHFRAVCSNKPAGPMEPDRNRQMVIDKMKLLKFSENFNF